ncbi:MAG: TolC family outer membrane protein [Rhodospirillales bacterium]
MTEELQALVEYHSRIKAAEADVTSAEELAKVSLGDWFPTVSFTAGVGYERQHKGNGTDDTSMPPRDANVTLDQKVWDFGATNAGIERSRLTEDQARVNLVSTRQTLILEGVTAYLDVMRQFKLVKFARASVENIKKQAELEDSRVERGSGFSTDVLQAKTQLAGAEARLTQAQGALKVALNRYRAVFGHDSGKIDDMSVPATPFEELPESLDEAIEIAIRDNPGLVSAAKDAEILRATERETRADELFPSIDASLSQTVEEDADGTVGNNSETLLLLELSYDFGVTGTNHSAVYAARQDAIASENRYIDARDLLEEQVRNAWDNLMTATENARHLNNQADIAAEFLELARKDRALGNRSLIDVLSGETALINASSDAASAETDVAIAVYTLLASLGKLEI